MTHEQINKLENALRRDRGTTQELQVEEGYHAAFVEWNGQRVDLVTCPYPSWHEDKNCANMDAWRRLVLIQKAMSALPDIIARLKQVEAENARLREKLRDPR